MPETGELVGHRRLTPAELEHLNYIESSRAELRAALEERDGPDCFYCEGELDLENRTIDHVIPQREARRRGWEMESTHGLGNLVLSCRTCNSLKGDRLLNEDGTIPPRPMSRKRRKAIKSARPEVCKTCMSGRKLRVDETCSVCYSGPQPVIWPTFYQKTAKDCSHGWDDPMDHCAGCVTGWLGVRPESSRKVRVESGLSVSQE